MKRMIFIIALSVLPFLVGAQGFIDDLISKYSGNANVTTIVISKNLLDFAFTLDNDKDGKLEKLKGKISDLKILISEKKTELSIELIDEIKGYMGKDNFLTLIEIIDGKKRVNLYVKKENDKVVHLLLLAKEENQEVMLSLQGQFTMKDLADLGKGTNINGHFHHLSYLKNIEK